MTFSRSHDRRVCGSQRKVMVCGDEFCDPQPIASHDGFGDQVAFGEIGEESDFRLDPQSGLQQVRHFRDYQRRHEQRTGMGLEKFEARLVVSIVSIDVCEERPGVDDQRDEPNSAARISSIRSEISVRPLAPAPAARSRLRPSRPPRCASIASLVISEMVVPRRCASWRSRASRSSGNFTVVRFMYASIPDAGHPAAAVGRVPA
jgi:hypothetical protein